MLKNRKLWIYGLALGLGSGLSPKAPGTVGTVVAVPLYILLSYLSPVHYMGVVFMLALVGIYLCDVTARDFGVLDDPRIVWDEIVGYLLTMFLAPTGWYWIVLGFALFRLFDILKPWPVKLCETKMKGGLGIMADDWLAAGYAWLILQAVYSIFKLISSAGLSQGV